MRTRAIPERFCSAVHSLRGAILSVWALPLPFTTLRGHWSQLSGLSIVLYSVTSISTAKWRARQTMRTALDCSTLACRYTELSRTNCVAYTEQRSLSTIVPAFKCEWTADIFDALLYGRKSCRFVLRGPPLLRNKAFLFHAVQNQSFRTCCLAVLFANCNSVVQVLGN